MNPEKAEATGKPAEAAAAPATTKAGDSGTAPATSFEAAQALTEEEEDRDFDRRRRPTSLPLRSFNRFEFDSGTVRGVWAEANTFFFADEETDKIKTDTTEVAALLAVGTGKLEAGALLPYRDLDIEEGDKFGTAELDGDGIGDLRVYAKAIPLRTALVDLGGGIQLTLPTGDEDEGLGSDELGFIPFATGSVNLGPAELRAHGGYGFFTDRNNESAPESIVYGGGLFAPILGFLGLRAEVAGRTFRLDGPDVDKISFYGGVDLAIPLDGPMLVLRPTGSVGLTDDAPEWGVGGGIAVIWDLGWR